MKLEAIIIDNEYECECLTLDTLDDSFNKFTNSHSALQLTVFSGDINLISVVVFFDQIRNEEKEY